MSNQLKDIYPRDWCECSLKIIVVPTIQLIPKEIWYDVEGSTNKFTVSLHLDDPTLNSSSSKKRKAEDGSDVTTEEDYSNSIKQRIRKLYKEDAAAYLVIKGKPSFF